MTYTKEMKLQTLQARMEKLSEMLDSLEPEKTDLEDIDRLIGMLDDLENQCRQYRRDYE